MSRKPVDQPNVPGQPYGSANGTQRGDSTAGLKRGTGKDQHIVLNPQPSQDPNDPLNWPLWKKEVIILVLCFGGMLNAGVNGPLLNASYSSIAQEINVELSTVVLVSGYNLLIAGAAGPFICALSRKYGKRPVYLASTLFAIIGTAVGQARVSYEYLLASRIIQGLSTSAFESLVAATVGDLYFVHQRGSRVAALNFVLNAASSLASIICGVVFANLGWLWLFHLFQVFLVVQFILMLLFCPETTYIRDVKYDLDIANTLHAHGRIHKEEEEEHAAETGGAEHIATTKTFVQELAVYNGKFHDDYIFKDLFGPILVLLNPAAAYAVLCSGLLNAWYVGSAIIIAGIFAGPPWNFGPAEIGYIGAGPFIGGLIGSLVTLLAGDPVIKWLGKKNKGYYEPEFRLVFMALSALGCGIGMFLFGYTMSIRARAEVCAFFFGVQMFGILIGIWSTISYGLDAFRNLSSEIFVMNMVFKNFMFYALSVFANDWVASKGPRGILYVFGGTSLLLCALAVPVYVFGKNMRSWWARHDLFVLFKMQTTGPTQELG